jgi:hypothetical protein
MWSVVGSVGRFVWFAIKPGASLINLVLALGVITIPTIATYFLYDVSASLIVLFIVLSVLFLIAGVTRQRELEASREAQFDCEGGVERIEGQVPETHGIASQRGVSTCFFWVYVENDGPTSTFSGTVPSVEGVPDSWKINGKYDLRYLGCDDGTIKEAKIARRQRGRIMLAAAHAMPHEFSFYTANEETRFPGHPFPLALGARFTFTLRIINVGSRDETADYDGVIDIPGIPEKLGASTFTLTLRSVPRDR